jgi:hypothetical protein
LVEAILRQWPRGKRRVGTHVCLGGFEQLGFDDLHYVIGQLRKVN